MASNAKDNNFFKVFEDYIFGSIRTFMPAQVLSFDKQSMTADVQPAFLMTPDIGIDPVKMGMLQDVPVINHRFEYLEEKYTGSGAIGDHQHTEELVTRIMTPIYKKGDMVMLAICDRNIDNLQKGLFLPNSSKKFSVNDAVIIGGWSLS